MLLTSTFANGCAKLVRAAVAAGNGVALEALTDYTRRLATQRPDLLTSNLLEALAAALQVTEVRVAVSISIVLQTVLLQRPNIVTEEVVDEMRQCLQATQSWL
mmetsp:Transcript_62361/g.86142  ORF Transcript_62361/g.86142 Transcript_62361/m.86142 type:complete len:103 (-) Transcript_62361:66-374(-)